MLDHLAGEVVTVEPTRVVLRAHGIGFELLVPLATSAALRPGQQATVYTHLHISESPRLLAFATRPERDFCRRLLKVAGVGPAMAIAVLASGPLEQVKASLAAGDEEALTAIRGVGRKTAQRLILDLAEELRREPLPAQAGGRAAERDALAALISLGLSEKEARSALARAVKARPGGEAAELIRLALAGSA